MTVSTEGGRMYTFRLSYSGGVMEAVRFFIAAATNGKSYLGPIVVLGISNL